MPFGIRASGSKWEVYNESTGRVAGSHGSKKKAKAQLRALYSNVDDASKMYSPAQPRNPAGGGRSSGEFAAVGRQKPRSSGSGGGAGSSSGSNNAQTAATPTAGGGDGTQSSSAEAAGASDEHSEQVRAAQDRALAAQFEKEAQNLESELSFTRSMLQYLRTNPNAASQANQPGSAIPQSAPGSTTAASGQSSSQTQQPVAGAGSSVGPTISQIVASTYPAQQQNQSYQQYLQQREHLLTQAIQQLRDHARDYRQRAAAILARAVTAEIFKETVTEADCWDNANYRYIYRLLAQAY